MFRLTPPAGMPILKSDYCKAAWHRFKGRKTPAEFEGWLLSLTNERYCFLLNSGRSSLAVILRALSKLSSTDKQEVIIPAYTCYSVAATIIRCGLKIRPIDINPTEIDYNYDDLKKTDFSHALAIVSCNLFSLPSNWDTLSKLAKANGIFSIDDAAQTLGVKYGDRASGACGDVGFFSFGRGKNLPTYSGGAIVTSDDNIAQKLKEEINSLPDISFLDELGILSKSGMYTIFLNPYLYWIPASLPFLKIGETEFDVNFAMHRYSRFLESLASLVCRRFDMVNRSRIDNSQEIVEGLRAQKNYPVPRYDSKNCPPYLRLPVLLESRGQRDMVIKELRKQGIVASAMYPSSIPNIPGIETHLSGRADKYPGADYLVERLLCLPTHPYLNKEDIRKIISIIVKA